MGFFKAEGLKEYEDIAAMNDGTVAIILETRNGKKSPHVKLAVLVDKPRKYSIKMNELKFFEKAFDAKFPKRSESTYCRFEPLKERFEILDDVIRTKESGEDILIKKVTFYEGLLDR